MSLVLNCSLNDSSTFWPKGSSDHCSFPDRVRTRTSSTSLTFWNYKPDDKPVMGQNQNRYCPCRLMTPPAGEAQINKLDPRWRREADSSARTGFNPDRPEAGPEGNTHSWTVHETDRFGPLSESLLTDHRTELQNRTTSWFRTGPLWFCSATGLGVCWARQFGIKRKFPIKDDSRTQTGSPGLIQTTGSIISDSRICCLDRTCRTSGLGSPESSVCPIQIPKVVPPGPAEGICELSSCLGAPSPPGAPRAAGQCSSVMLLH